MNDKPYSHVSSNGTTFKCERCDFRSPIKALRPGGLSDENFAVDVSEMIGDHARGIWPNLNGFQGYSALKYEIVLCQ